jgi:hypothetical protein
MFEKIVFFGTLNMEPVFESSLVQQELLCNFLHIFWYNHFYMFEILYFFGLNHLCNDFNDLRLDY